MGTKIKYSNILLNRIGLEKEEKTWIFVLLPGFPLSRNTFPSQRESKVRRKDDCGKYKNSLKFHNFI